MAVSDSWFLTKYFSVKDTYYRCLQLTKTPYGSLSEYEQNVSPGMDVYHLVDAYVLNTLDDMFLVKESCPKCHYQ